MMGVSVFGRLNYFANNTTTTAPNKWMILREKSYSGDEDRISSHLKNFFGSAMVSAQEKRYFSNNKYPYDLSDEKACYVEMNAYDAPSPIQEQTNASVLHAYFLCDDICCGDECCEINPNFLLMIVSLGVSLGTLCWLFCCVIFFKWHRPHGKGLSANDYVEIPLVRTSIKERAPQQYRTRPARSAEKVRRNDDVIE